MAPRRFYVRQRHRCMQNMRRKRNLRTIGAIDNFWRPGRGLARRDGTYDIEPSARVDPQLVWPGLTASDARAFAAARAAPPYSVTFGRRVLGRRAYGNDGSLCGTPSSSGGDGALLR